MKKLILTLFWLACATQGFAQAGYSSASHSRGRQMSDNLILPKPHQVVVEEYFNYHRHQIPLPAQGKAVGLDLCWGNKQVSDQQSEVFLQVGFTTARSSGYIDETPLNIAIVIDRSGSMGGQRIEHARQSAKALVGKLRDQDRVSIVVFDNQIETLLEFEKGENKQRIKQIIDGIEVRGSTDLNGGLIRGYELIAKNLIEKGNNKVLLLTDVLTNTGEVDVENIIKNANNYSQNHQIGVTLVAIGVQINEELARQITKSGRHSFHYVNDSQDIQKIFVEEVESILSAVAKEVELTLTFDDNLELLQCYGYSPKISQNTLKLSLNNMNAGLTQVVLTKLQAKKPSKGGKVRASLTYLDIATGKRVTQELATELTYSSAGANAQNNLKEPEVRKCVSIAEMAMTLQEMARFLDKQNPSKEDYRQAKDAIDIQIGEVKKRYRQEMDADVDKVLKMLESYANALGTVARR